MLTVVRNVWALLLGIFLLMIGNGMHGTLLGVRGASEFESAATMSWVISGYFVGFLGGSRLAPELIRRVGHVRVFAALGSLISAALVLFPVFPNALFWIFLRVVIGFCFSGVYVVAESWLNDNSANETRGKTLSVYIIVQLLGVISAQAMLNLGDPGGYLLFVIASVLVSVSFAPILLSVSPAPITEMAPPMSLRRLIRISPLGAVGSFCIGALFSGMWGMSPVYGTEIGLSVAQISLFVATIYIGGMLCQFPIGWLSDRMDRRHLVLATTGILAVVTVTGSMLSGSFELLLLIAFLIGALINPLYSLIIAFTNDILDPGDMASAAGCLIFIQGVGAIGGPLAVGLCMLVIGPNGFFIYLSIVAASLAAFTLYRMSVRAAITVDQPAIFTPVSQTSSPVAVDMAQEIAIEPQLQNSDEAGSGA
ncbi:MAG: MFS transporter [Rhodobacteraceae bacterium]|nr:MFS transporter [Paracoccaceae bacterium]